MLVSTILRVKFILLLYGRRREDHTGDYSEIRAASPIRSLLAIDLSSPMSRQVVL